MPEALVAVPPLQIPSENSSEVENSSTTAEVTDRSTNRRNDDLQVGATKKKHSVESQSKNKLRKSYGKRFQKKTQLRPLTKSSLQKTTSALQLKSHIPRALVLTPSSSTTSLTTNDSLPSPLLPIARTASQENQLEAKISSRSCLIRQRSGIILAFRQRKSISQMDFNHARRQMNFPIPTTPTQQSKDDLDKNKALIPSTCGENMAMAYSQNSLVHKLYNRDNYYLAMPGRDPQMAGMRIFATIMLNAWRKRRDEVKHLMDEVADLKRGAIKSKNQLHVFNTLFRVEQKRNDELNCQLKRSLADIHLTKTSCESLTTSLISLKADKALLEQQLQTKEQEFESLNSLLTQTKSDLFKSMTIQRELQASLSMEQRKIQTLENQKNELINEICDLNNEAMQKEEGLRKEIQMKTTEFSQLNNKLIDAEEQIKTLKQSSNEQLSESKAKEDRMKQEIEILENDLKIMHKCLQETFGSRLKSCWSNSLTYQKITLQMLHWLAYYVLPATPPPKMKALPFGLSLDKALSIVKR